MNGRALLGSAAVALAIPTGLLFAFSQRGAPRETAFVFLGAFLSVLLAFLVQIIAEHAINNQIRLLTGIQGELSKTASAVDGVSSQVTSTAEGIDQLRQAASAGTEAVKVAVSGVSAQMETTVEGIEQLRQAASAGREDVLRMAEDARSGTAVVKSAVLEVSAQVESTTEIIDQLRRTASAARADALRMKLTGLDSITGIDLQGTSLAGLVLPPRRDLTGASLQGVVWSTVEADRAVFAGARLEGASISGTLNQALFSDAFLQGCRLTGNFGGSSFEGAILDGTRLRGCFRGSLFSQPKAFIGVHAAVADLRDCRFGGIDYVLQSCFWAAALGESEFLDTCLGACDFRWSVLSEARFRLTPRMSALTRFDGALLGRTDFRETPAAVLRELELAGAIDAGALWPDGFDAAAAGVLPIEGKEGMRKLREHLQLREHGEDCPQHGEQPVADE